MQGRGALSLSGSAYAQPHPYIVKLNHFPMPIQLPVLAKDGLCTELYKSYRGRPTETRGTLSGT